MPKKPTPKPSRRRPPKLVSRGGVKLAKPAPVKPRKTK